MSDVLIVGRGPSVYEYDSWGGLPTMAVSSGILGMPQDVRVDHIVTMDALKFFMQPVQLNGYGWRTDERAVSRPFWSDAEICKHVPVSRAIKHGHYRDFHPGIMEAVPDHLKPSFVAELGRNVHLFGFQPSWGDCSNVRGWSLHAEGEPNFGDGTDHLRLGGINNSWLMAVQVAPLLGYRRLHFLGCDFNMPHYKELVGVACEWHRKAKAVGLEWFNLSPSSRLADFVPTTDVVTC